MPLSGRHGGLLRLYEHGRRIFLGSVRYRSASHRPRQLAAFGWYERLFPVAPMYTRAIRISTRSMSLRRRTMPTNLSAGIAVLVLSVASDLDEARSPALLGGGTTGATDGALGLFACRNFNSRHAAERAADCADADVD